MLLVAPFRGLRYNPKKVGSLSRVVTPPYDVISPAGQRSYYRRHPLNFIRIAFGLERRTDDAGSNRYLRAKETLDSWLESGILRADPEPSFYPYAQEYRMGGKTYRRLGVIALVHLGASRIFPHEETREEPLLDRLHLLETVHAALSPIFGLVPDENRLYRKLVLHLCKGRPIAAAQLDGVRHRLWRVSDPELIRRVSELLKGRDLVIADGHHRYEAARRFYERMQKRESYQYAMFYLAVAEKDEPGLLPTHRVLKGVPLRRLEQFRKAMKDRGLFQSVPTLRRAAAALEQLQRRGEIGVGVYSGNGSTFIVEAGGRGRSNHPLDVEWLHGKLISEWFKESTGIVYTQDAQQAARRIRKDKKGILFLMQRPRLTEVFHRAQKQKRMPGKTTYFYPKPLDGLVEYKFKL